MESRNEFTPVGLVSRAIALALAVVATTVVSVGSAAIVTRGADAPHPGIEASVPSEDKEIRFG